MDTSKVNITTYIDNYSIEDILLYRLINWSEVRMSIGHSFLSQTHRPPSGNKVHAKDDWLRQVKYIY